MISKDDHTNDKHMSTRNSVRTRDMTKTGTQKCSCRDVAIQESHVDPQVITLRSDCLAPSYSCLYLKTLRIMYTNNVGGDEYSDILL